MIIFDLDGTLVDSSAGILESLAASFADCSVIPAKPLTPTLIGPPLRNTLQLISPNSDDSELDQLTTSFKTYYDTVGFKQTTPFPGIEQMLRFLVDAGLSLNIATNKRQVPTQKIVSLLGWSGLFDQVLSPDSFGLGLPDKAKVLGRLIAKANYNAKDCLYVGDRLDDYRAAEEAGIPFGLAEWGFEGDGSEFPIDTIRIEAPDATKLLAHFSSRTSSYGSRK